MQQINIYFDESCHLLKDNSNVLGIGCLYCPVEYKKEIMYNIRAIKRKHNFSRDHEIKWTKVSKGKIQLYKDLIDYLFEENHNSIENLKKRVKDQNEEINDLKYDLNNKDNEISSLKSKIKELKDSLEYWKDKFQRVVKFIHDKIHDIFGDKDDKYKEMADNLFINGIMDEKEYTSVINKKRKNSDDFER